MRQVSFSTPIEKISLDGMASQEDLNVVLEPSSDGFVWILVVSSDSCLDVHGVLEERNALGDTACRVLRQPVKAEPTTIYLRSCGLVPGAYRIAVYLAGESGGIGEQMSSSQLGGSGEQRSSLQLGGSGVHRSSLQLGGSDVQMSSVQLVLRSDELSRRMRPGASSTERGEVAAAMSIVARLFSSPAAA